MLAQHLGPTDWSFGDEIVRLLQNLLEADFAIAAISKRWFDGHQVLFNELLGKLRKQIAEALELADSYNRLLDVGCPVI